MHPETVTIRRHLTRVLPLLVITVALAAGDAAAPSADEALILDRLNAYRADRVRGDSRIATLIAAKRVAASLYNWNHTGQGAGGAGVVPNALLTAAARALVADPARPPVRETDAPALLRQAGYEACRIGAVLQAAGSADLDTAFAEAVTRVVHEVDVNRMFARRFLLDPAWREVGIAVRTVQGRVSLAIVLGAGTARRHAGGLVYRDANRNGAYDAGEGVAGVAVAIGGATTASTAAGAWSLALDADDAGTVAFAQAQAQASLPLARGATNAWACWRVPPPEDLKEADRLIAEAGRSGAAQAEAQRALLVALRRLVLDDRRQAAAAAAVAPLRDRFDSMRLGLARAMGEDPAAFARCLAEARKAWPGRAAGAWFAESEGLYRLRAQVLAARALPDAKKPAPPTAQLLAALAEAEGRVRDPEHLASIRQWIADLRPLAVPAAGGTARR